MSAQATHSAEVVEEQFESLERQAHAGRLGMWVFLASEVLLFGALFGLYATLRTHEPAVFESTIHENAKVPGSINTAILLTSSVLAACGVRAVRVDRLRLAGLFVGGTMLLGLGFLFVKGLEWSKHIAKGITPGHAGEAWTLYYLMTGLHALHVIAGLAVLTFVMQGLLRGTITAVRSHRIEIAVLYWHFVDVIWIFLWPLFYLA